MHTGPQPVGERWNVNMPAVIGVVFVFLVGVVIWVLATSGGDDPDDAAPPAGDATTDAETIDAETTVPTGGETTLTLSPTPLPVTAPPTEPSIAPTTTPTTTPVTTAPGAGDDSVPGDLAVPDRSMQRPPCDGSFITVLASAVGDQATAGGIAAVLDQYPGSNYLRTDQTCSSLNPAVNGEPIYVVFLGPFVVDTDACAARADGPEGAYARQLSNDVSPQHSVDCP
jgi:serine/threonine-protein kinase